MVFVKHDSVVKTSRGYETLQACASISVPKLCNFHFQYLVNFLKKYNSFFSPKYLSLSKITSSYKIFCKKKIVCVLRKAFIFVMLT